MYLVCWAGSYLSRPPVVHSCSRGNTFILMDIKTMMLGYLTGFQLDTLRILKTSNIDFPAIIPDNRKRKLSEERFLSQLLF
jgi:hypothetical protein